MKRLLIISYLSQAYVVIIGMIMMPIYLRYMGPENFGLIGIFLMLQTWVQLFDLGLSPTLSREMSRFKAGSVSKTLLWQRLRCLEWLFFLISILILGVFFVTSEYIARHWLDFKTLGFFEVKDCILAMIISAVLRWLSGLYRFSLNGLERQLWVNGAMMVFATLKFVLVIPLLFFDQFFPLSFFLYQVLVSALELVVYRWKLYKALPKINVKNLFQLRALKSILPLIGSMGFLSIIWIFVTQIDKLVLSRTVSLENFGYFTLVTTMAGGLLMLLPPLNQILQPRMTILKEQRKFESLKSLYRTASQCVTALFFSLGGGMAFYAESILYIWTGDIMIAKNTAPILFWYGLANALIGSLIMPFLLQFSYGYLKLHVIGNVLLSIILLPVLFYTSSLYGAVGTGVALLIVWLVFLLLWVPIVHNKLLPSITVTWILHDVIKVVCVVLACLYLGAYLMPVLTNKSVIFIYIFFSIVLAFCAGILTGNRSRIFFRIKRTC